MSHHVNESSCYQSSLPLANVLASPGLQSSIGQHIKAEELEDWITRSQRFVYTIFFEKKIGSAVRIHERANRLSPSGTLIARSDWILFTADRFPVLTIFFLSTSASAWGWQRSTRDLERKTEIVTGNPFLLTSAERRIQSPLALPLGIKPGQADGMIEFLPSRCSKRKAISCDLSLNR